MVISHGPVEGTPYSWMPERRVEIVRKNVWRGGQWEGEWLLCVRHVLE